MIQYHRKSYAAYFFAKICCPYLDIRGAVQLVDGRDHGIGVDIGQALRQLLFALLGLGIVYNDFDGGAFSSPGHLLVCLFVAIYCGMPV